MNWGLEILLEVVVVVVVLLVAVELEFAAVDCSSVGCRDRRFSRRLEGDLVAVAVDDDGASSEDRGRRAFPENNLMVFIYL
jgi:uncharacterized protein (DUF1786 family)